MRSSKTNFGSGNTPASQKSQTTSSGKTVAAFQHWWRGIGPVWVALGLFLVSLSHFGSLSSLSHLYCQKGGQERNKAIALLTLYSSSKARVESLYTDTFFLA